MSVSETLLSVVAFRLAVLVLLAATAQALPARSQHAASVPPPAVVSLPPACAPVAQGGREQAIQEMLSHD